MNKINYQIIFSKYLGMLVAVGENACARGKSASGECTSRGIMFLQNRSAKSTQPFLLASAAPSGGGIFVGCEYQTHAPIFMHYRNNKSFFTRTMLVKRLSPFVLFFIGTLVSAQPSGPTVRQGSVQFDQTANQLRIQQLSDTAIVNWQSFSIPAGHSVNIAQPGSGSAILNRVTGADPSRLMGQLTANGRVYLINPNGILVGNGARIDAGAFIASTLDVSDQDFLAGGDMGFFGSSNASVQNLGSITASNGDVILIGHEVSNQGSVTSEGVTALAAGLDVLLTPMGDQRIQVLTSVKTEDHPSAVGAENAGIIEAVQAELKAAGGNVYDLAVNQAGIIRATGLENRNGRILLTSNQGFVSHSGELIARNADGSGGEILLGGDLQGGNPLVANAARTFVSESAILDVSAENGHAGRVIVWADKSTDFRGRIEGRGAESGGDGAFAEVSGKQTLNFQGLADLRAPAGRIGQLLLDPASLTIQAAGPDTNLMTTGSNPATTVADARVTPSILTVSTLEAQLALSDVILDTSVTGPRNGDIDFTGLAPVIPAEYPDGSIVVNSPIQWSTGTTLNFNSANNIEVNASINGGATGDIVFGLGRVADAFSNPFILIPASTGELIVDAAATVTANTVLVKPSVLNFAADTFASEGALGGVDFNGILNTNVLEIRYPVDLVSEFGGFLGAVSFDNPANTIGTLRGDVDSGRLQGNFTVIDSAGGLRVENEFVADFGAEIRIVTSGNLTLASGALITTGTYQGIPSAEESDIYLAARGGNFTNQAGLSGVNAAGSGRFLIYGSNPGENSPGGLIGDPVYNKTYDANAPSTITQTGDRFLFSLAPTLTLTANPASKQQGDANPAFGFTTSGLYAGDAAADVFSGTPTLSTTATDASPAGNYAIDVALGTVVRSDFDYLINLVSGVLTIDPGPIQNLLITANNAFKTFGEANPFFTATYSLPAAAENVTGLQFNVSALSSSSVGDYTINPFGASGVGYNISFAPGTLTINPRLLTIGAQDIQKVYGDLTPAFSPTFDNLALFHGSADLGPLTLTSPASAQFADADTYDITPSGAVNSNYTISYSPGTALVTPRPVTLTAINDSREYGEANPILFATPTGFVNNDYNRANLTIGTSATTASNVGGYAIVPAAYNDSNYTVTFVNDTLNVTRAPLLLTAGNALRVYGDANPSFSFSGSGFKNAEDESVVQNVVFETPAVPASNVNTYAIDITGAVSGNYDLNFAPGTLTVNRRPILINVANTTRDYGDANPAFGPANANTNLLPALDPIGEVLSFTSPASPTDFVGDYPITASLLNPNYSLSTTPGTLRVDPRELFIAVGDARRDYGDPNPAFNFSVVSLKRIVNGDDVGAMLNLQTVAPSPANTEAGFYLIRNSGNLDPRRYRLGLLFPGVLTVTPRPITLRVDNAQSLFAGINDFRSVGNLENLPYTASADNLAPGDTVSGNVFPGLSFRTFSIETMATVVSANYRDTMMAPDFDSPAFVNGFALFNQPPPTEMLRLLTAEGLGFSAEVDRETFRGVAPDQGYLLQNRNYVVTSIVPFTGIRTIAPTSGGTTGTGSTVAIDRPFRLPQPSSTPEDNPDSIPIDLFDITDITLTPTELGHLPSQQPLVIRSLNEYASNLGLVFFDFPDVAEEMIMNELNRLFQTGGLLGDEETLTLFKAIFGDQSSKPPFDPEQIRAWLADIETNPEKRAMLGVALVNYLATLQAIDPTELTQGQSRLVEVVLHRVNEKRREVAEDLIAKESIFTNAPNASRVYAGVRAQMTKKTGNLVKLAAKALENDADAYSEGEQMVLQSMLFTLLDGDSSSSITALEAWFSERGDRVDSKGLDGQFLGLLEDLRSARDGLHEAKTAMDSGVDMEDNKVLQSIALYSIENVGTPYGEILKDSSFEALEAKMARYTNIGKNKGALSLGAGAAAGSLTLAGVSAAASYTSAGVALLPYKFLGAIAKGTAAALAAGKTAAAATASASVGVGAGAVALIPAAVAAAVGAATVWGGITAVQQAEQKTIFDTIVEGGSKAASLQDLNFNPQTEDLATSPKAREMADVIFKTILADSLDEMLLGF